MDQNKIRNIAIIAHVDHGKTTLVDQILKQCGTFHEGEEVNERVMDSGAIERERGITILSKNASVNYKGYHINIVDTPGHADFGGQVERVLGTVDGVLLIVDAFEGPMAQTRFVTQKALALGLTPIVVINKIDRDGCNPHNALDKVFDLFCELNATEEQLDFSCVYASGRKGICRKEVDDPDGDLRILMDLVIDKIPAPKGDPKAAPLLQISTLEYSSFLGRMAVGRVQQGTFKTGMTVAQSFLTDDDTATPKVKNIRIQKILHYDGIQSVPIDEAGPGEIIQIAGLEMFDIGDTLSAVDNPVHLPRIHIDPPTISMLFTVNTSPLAGKGGGKFLTGNNLAERLERAHMADPALLVEKAEGASTFKVSGRGILHLTILIESMRRELYEFTIGSPQVIFQKDENGKILEPMEQFKVEVPSEYSGPVIEELGHRKGEMVDMVTDDNNRVSLEYKIPSRGLLGIRSKLLSLTKGYAVSQSLFLDFEPYKGDIPARVNGVLIAKEPGQAASYALSKLEDRGSLFIPPATEVYPGMIIGEHNRTTDIIVNATKGKHLTNMRSKASDDNIQLTPYRRMTLEECVTFINDDECVEVTPQCLRLRKITLDPHLRKQESKAAVEDDDDD
ncbi:MAG: translational GTPase TypA [Hallerella porci]|uniref:50S ribosomal subunit assembly factor BipA n=1 Tax=Hallerella porci TaxID=1945871 RepID=A0ABX5LP27_9BACT|nr:MULTISPECIES: translational GTPase TypA [Hallerella]MCI5600914.1 translational GTPase TypA [Hallerella sp.]MDY3922216.1 translational GTPase TypA [Hallerella porci]PWL04166.1 GTP-binding protein TypA/BipA [Hallerella porci]